MNEPVYKHTVTIEPAPITYRIITQQQMEDGTVSEWRECHLVSINEATGHVSIEGGYGTFSYVWRHIGDRTLHHFLAGLDFGYFMEKAAKQTYRIADTDGTIAKLKREIIEDRRRNDIDKTVARQLWDDLEDHDVDSNLVEYLYRTSGKWCERLDYTDPTIMVDHPATRRFWNEIWRPFCETTLMAYPDKVAA